MRLGIQLRRWGLAGICSAILAALAVSAAPAEKNLAAERGNCQKLYDAGNYKDAYVALRLLVLDPADDRNLVAADFNLAVTCLQQLGRIDEIDELREAAIKSHAQNWRLLQAAADSYLNGVHYGFIVAGKFSRGPHRGGGDAVNSTQRDRVRALQLMAQAMPLVKAEPHKTEVANYWLSLAKMLLSNRDFNEAWRLGYLTNLGDLPDYDQGWFSDAGSKGAPVDSDGNPIFYREPKNWESAQTDGERWRWALSQAVENDPQRRNDVRYQLAEFLESQFGVQTMAYFGAFFSTLQDSAAQGSDDSATASTNDGNSKSDHSSSAGGSQPEKSGPWAVNTLAEDETIARLANGIRRFKLPEEFDFLRIYRQIADEPQTGHGEDALGQLAQIFENRRQYARAADWWQRNIKEFGPGGNDFKKLRLQQIIGNWGRFEPIMTQPSGQGAMVDFRYRNGSKVSFEAREINIAKLLADVKAYLKSNPRQLDWQKLNIADLGLRLVQQDEQQLVGQTAAQWDLALDPLPAHFDRRITVSTPLQKAGAYLLTAKMADGNTSQIILWLQDTAIVKKPLSGATFYYVADSQNGAPIAKATLDFFGYRQRSIGQNQFTIDTRDYADATDANGEVIVAPKEQDEQFQWIVTATTADGRLAYLGFTGVWSGNTNDVEYNQTKVYTITDRPAYRPGQKVHYKFWIRHAQYDQDEKSDFANQTFNIEIQNPKGEKFLTKAATADNYGGIEGDFELPADATLGVYQLFVVNYGGSSSFRVEEYKKPEFEVAVDAPAEPVMLGEKFKATVEAKYYFGSPVTQAKVKYKIIRTTYNGQWYPLGRWDWLYGPGYWWFAEDYAWYPGWQQWGCPRAMNLWWGFNTQPPEVVEEGETQIGPNGKVELEIDTTAAKLVHPDQDHRYTITAEVVDASRRTIVGQGSTLVARKPFRVYAWVDRGYYHAGDTIRVEFQSQTLDQKPIHGKGTVNLYQIAYANGKPQETLVRSWDELDPDAQGHAELQLNASAAGQYRVSYQLTDDKQRIMEGGYLFSIVGQGFDSRDFRFNNLELITDQREYSPGQSVNLMVNANEPNSTVLLFLRPTNGVYSKPKVLHLDGKSATEQIAIVKKDMPNFFVEAVTITGGRLYDEIKQVVVPPESRVLDVAVVPSSETYKPGEKATVNIKLTDSAGQPFVGSTVLSIYDKAVEYISRGSNVQDIKAFFWKWQRSHYPQNETNLMRQFSNLVPLKLQAMSNIGIFGETTTEELLTEVTAFSNGISRLGTPRMGGALMMAAAAPAMPAPAAPPGDNAAETAKSSAAGGENDAAPVEPTVRTNFADTALWAGELSTDENGAAQVSLVMPENLTTWKIRAWGLGHGTKVGEGQAEVVTRKNIIVRMEGPRFFVEKDQAVLSAVVHNYLKTSKQVTVALELEGKCLTALADVNRQVEVPKDGEIRVDWPVKVDHEGQAVIRMKALSDEESDAVEDRFPVYVHGVLKTESFSSTIRPDESVGKISLRVPAERRVHQSRLEVRYSPTLAGAMVDALPYLADYPYGCTEQTLNRFLPTVITQHILINMGLDLKKIQQQHTNLNAQEIGDDVHRAAEGRPSDYNPVFDQAEVNRMVKDGVQALTQMQLSDGGWGWFSGWGEQSYPHTTALVVHGLQIAKDNDVALPPGVLERGIEWLKNYQSRQVQELKNAHSRPQPIDPYKSSADNLDALVHMVLVDASIADDDMRGFLFRDRKQLAIYSQAMFGLALQKRGQEDQLHTLLENIRQFVVQDDENQTAYLKLPENNYWWFWYGSDIEANAYYLKLLAKSDPKSQLASRLVKYLLNNRQHATYWNSTRDTAVAIEALADYLRVSGEDQPDLTVEVWLDGKQQKEVKITPAELFTFDNKFVLEGDAVETGVHQLELRKKGTGPLYFNAYLTNFTLEDPIAAAGLEVKVNRKYYKLTPVDQTVKVSGSLGQAVDQKVDKYQREELPNLTTLKSGDLVEVELEIDSKNDYEYVMFADMKPAGFEPVELRSGYNGNSLGAYMEMRDNQVAFFVRWLARGKHSVSYRLRSEVPGQFSALPAAASAMYAPELRGNSGEMKLKISD